ncbi:MAG: protein kinase [Blastocatellia bacterium]
MPIAPNSRFDHYEIIAPLGAGGMGEVYRARDTRLHREVALKVLPTTFAQDADRLRRFEQEAKATSSLNHPNILTVHDFGLHDGAPYIVMELLDGEELRAQLGNGALPVRKAIDYAQQIVAGLAAAHEKGIVHRDLKPENLFVTKDQRVKILDFGLAKLRKSDREKERRRDSGQEDQDTLLFGAPGAPSLRLSVSPSHPLTQPGTVMGTVAYMSPEQVRGQDLEQRSDIFSFGLILYEMLAGQRAFAGESPAETMSAIAKEEPRDLSELNPKVTPPLEKIVRHCLEKKPEHRFQTARDLGFALEALAVPGSAGGSPATGVSALPALAREPRALSGRERLAWLIAGVLALLALALGVAYFKRAATDVRAVRLAFAPPENVTFDNGLDDSVVVSPDGQKLVFTGQSADGKRHLYVRPLDSMDATLLSGTDEPVNPFWSPDSRSLGFGSRGKLKRIDLASGRPQTLYDAFSPQGGAWSRAGVILFATGQGGGLFQIPATGGEPQPVTKVGAGESIHLFPWFLPDGRHFLYRVVGSEAQRTFVGSVDSKEVKPLLADGASAVYAPPGWIFFVRNMALMAQSFDPTRFELKGDAFPLTKPTDNNVIIGNPISVSENGVLIWQGDRQQESRLVWFDRAGRQEATVGPPIKVTGGQVPRLSPDEKHALIQRRDLQTRNVDIWVIDLARNLPIRLTSDPASDQYPLWSPDGSRVIFSASRGGISGLYQKAANNVGDEALLLKGGGITPTDWSADGQFIFYSRAAEKTRRDVLIIPLFGDRTPYSLLNSEFDEYQPQLSPDMHWLAYVSDESSNYEVYVQPFTTDGKLGGNKQRISVNGGNRPRFGRNGQELFYVAADGMMMAVKINGATFEPPKVLFKTRMLTSMTQSGIEYDVTADGQRFLIGTQVGEPSPVSVILNWTEGLKK